MNFDILFEESRESFGRVQGIQTFDKHRGKNKTFSLKKAGNPDVLFEERREPRHSNIRKQGIQTLSLKRTGKPDILKKIERNP